MARPLVVTIQIVEQETTEGPRRAINASAAWVEPDGSMMECDNPALALAALEEGKEVLMRNIRFAPPNIVRGIAVPPDGGRH